MKQCRICGQVKAYSAFYHLMPSGKPRGRVCKPCETQRVLVRRRELHPRKERVYSRQPVEQTRAKIKLWRDRNRERLNASARARYAANRETRLARQRELRARDPYAKEKDRAKAHSYNARRRDQFVEVVDPLVVWQRDGGVCGVCWEALDYSEFEVDHIVPLSRGGLHEMANVQAAHRRCNRSKGAKPGATPALIREAWDQACTAARATGKEPIVVLSYVDNRRRTFWQVTKVEA